MLRNDGEGMCVCICVSEREREVCGYLGERGKGEKTLNLPLKNGMLYVCMYNYPSLPFLPK